MKGISLPKGRRIFYLLLFAGLLPGFCLHAQFVTANGTVIQEYNLDGTPVKSGTLVQTGASESGGIAVSGSDIFMTTLAGQSVGEYTTSGSVVNASLISLGLTSNPVGIAASGSDIFIVDENAGTVDEYSVSGTTATPVGSGTLITGLHDPTGIAISGSDIFVANNGLNSSNKYTVGEYTTTGGTLNPSLVTGNTLLLEPYAIAVSGSNLFVTNVGQQFISEFVVSGTTAAAVGTGTFAKGGVDGANLNYAQGIAVSGTVVLVANYGNGTVAEYSTSGATLSGTLVQEQSGGPAGIAIIPEEQDVPTAPLWALLLTGAILILSVRHRLKA